MPDYDETPELPDDWETVHQDDEPATVFPLETGAQFLADQTYLQEEGS